MAIVAAYVSGVSENKTKAAQRVAKSLKASSANGEISRRYSANESWRNGVMKISSAQLFSI
jgi:hypothetical protein